MENKVIEHLEALYFSESETENDVWEAIRPGEMCNYWILATIEKDSSIMLTDVKLTYGPDNTNQTFLRRLTFSDFLKIKEINIETIERPRIEI